MSHDIYKININMIYFLIISGYYYFFIIQFYNFGVLLAKGSIKYYSQYLNRLYDINWLGTVYA